MIHSHTSFGKLKEVVVGRELKLSKRISDITFKQFYRESLNEKIYESPFEEYTVNQNLIEIRNEQLDDLAKILENLGVKVYRPKILDKIITFSTPSFKSELSSASNVRDLTLVYGNKLIETPTFVRNRYYENTLLHDVYSQAWDRGRGGQWIKAPHTELTEKTIDLGHWEDSRDYKNIPSNFVMAVDGAQFLRIGKDCIVNINSYNQYLGYEWVKSFFPETNFHVQHVADNHIDGSLISLCPGVFLVNPLHKGIEDKLPKKFRSWKFLYPKDLTKNIDVRGMTSVDIQLASERGMDINVLSLDEKKVLVSERAIGVIDILEKNNFEVIPIKLDHGEIFAGGIHCSTLDLVREDEYINY